MSTTAFLFSASDSLNDSPVAVGSVKSGAAQFKSSAFSPCWNVRAFSISLSTPSMNAGLFLRPASILLESALREMT